MSVIHSRCSLLSGISDICMNVVADADSTIASENVPVSDFINSMVDIIIAYASVDINNDFVLTLAEGIDVRT